MYKASKEYNDTIRFIQARAPVVALLRQRWRRHIENVESKKCGQERLHITKKI